MTAIANTKEAAQRLGLSARTLERWRLIGAGPPYHKLGSRVLYDIAAVDLWFEHQKRDTQEALAS